MSSHSGSFGGSGGSKFNDDIVGIRGMKIRHGNQVDSIQVTYILADGTIWEGPRHGGTGGSLSQFTLEEGEKLVKMEGKTNNALVDQLTFHSNKGKKYGPYGKTGQTSFSVEGELVTFFGSAGNLLDAISVRYNPL